MGTPGSPAGRNDDDSPIPGHPLWMVVDYDGNPLSGTWATHAEATEQGLLRKYFFRGFEVLPAVYPLPAV